MQIDDKISTTIQLSTSAFTADELIAVLERISSNTLKSESEIATKILKKHSREKVCYDLGARCLCVCRSLYHCNDTAKKLKTCARHMCNVPEIKTANNQGAAAATLLKTTQKQLK